MVFCALAGSRLMLLIPAPGPIEEWIRGRFAAEGIEAGRLELVSRRPLDQYLKLYHRIDIGLDLDTVQRSHDQLRFTLDGGAGDQPARASPVWGEGA